MYVEGRHLYTAAGDRVILRGVNAGIGWTDHPEREEHIRQIAASGANCLRIVWNPHRPNAVPGQNSRTPAQLDDVIGWTIENGMIPMVMLADAAGEPLRGSFNGELVKYWTQGEVPNILRKHERWLIINILNEGGRPDSSPQGPESDVDFVGFYAEEIGRLRGAGINVPLVIDAPNFGQNYQLIFNNWSTLRDSDPQRSVMFSVHTYFGGTFQNRQNIYDTIFDRVVEDNIPLLFGEGPTPTNTAPPGQGTCDASPWEHGLIGMHARDIGWLAWSWGVIRNGDCGQGGVNQFDLTKPGAQNGDWNTTYARQIMVDHNFSLRNTAVRPPGL